jgi:hypothetical protein
MRQRCSSPRRACDEEAQPDRSNKKIELLPRTIEK